MLEKPVRRIHPLTIVLHVRLSKARCLASSMLTPIETSALFLSYTFVYLGLSQCLLSLTSAFITLLLSILSPILFLGLNHLRARVSALAASCFIPIEMIRTLSFLITSYRVTPAILLKYFVCITLNFFLSAVPSPNVIGLYSTVVVTKPAYNPPLLPSTGCSTSSHNLCRVLCRNSILLVVSLYNTVFIAVWLIYRVY